jgi:outer membrane usher protein
MTGRCAPASRRFRAVVLACGLCMLAARARADADVINPELPDEMQAPFTLIVNHAKHGEINVLLRGGKVFVRRADLIEAGVRVPEGTLVQAGGEAFLALDSVTPPLSYVLDEQDIELEITAPTHLLPETAIDLAGRPPEVVYDTHSSGFLNYATRVNELGQIDLYEELGASFDGNLLFSSAYMSTEHRPIRGISNLVLDDREDLRRTTLGDALVTTGPLGGGYFVGGVTIARAFELDPYTITVPSLGYAGSTMTPATLDVYVNGARVRSEELAPGTFRLDNLRVNGGAGNARYVIRDVFGQERSIDMPFYVAGSVLKQGLQDYAYSLGSQRRFIGVRSWDYGGAIALGRHRIGVTDRLTLGARVEASDPVLSGGPQLAALSPIGQFDLELAASRDTGGGTGFSAFGAYGYVSRAFGVGVFGRVSSDAYANIGQRSATDRAVLEAGVNQSMPIGGSLSFSTNAAVAEMRDRGRLFRVGAQSSLRLGTRAALFLSGHKAWLADGTRPWEALLTLHVSFDGGHNASASARLQSGEPSALLDVHKSLPVGEGYGYRASATLAREENALAQLQYQTLFGRYGAQYQYLSSEHHAVGEAAGAIAVVPGVGLFPTLPVQAGFGVIRVAGVRDVRGYVNNQELGRTDRNGNLLVPHLFSHYGNRLSIAQQDVPMQYQLPETELTLAPPHRGVAVADFPLTIPHFYRGRLVIVEAGKRVIPKYGQVRLSVGAGEELVSPLGEQGEFELDGVTPGPRTLMIDYVGGTCELRVEIRDSDETIIDLGELTCVK